MMAQTDEERRAKNLRRYYEKKNNFDFQKRRHEYNVKYWAEHKDELKEKNRKWKHEHPNYDRDYHKQYFEKNRDVVLQRRRDYSIKNRDKINKGHREYYYNNKEKRHAQVKTYNENRKKRKEEVNECYKGLCHNKKFGKHRACEEHFFKETAKRFLGSEEGWIELKNIFYSQNQKCYLTGRLLIPGINASIDHVYSQSTHPELQQDITNLRWCDLEVNYSKRKMSIEEFDKLCEDRIKYKNNKTKVNQSA